jgi:molybdopterin-containing oxidoreductase family membrane subunit
MTVFAVACAALYPIIHLGRPWVVYFTLPYPNTMGVQPNFRSPLLWDVFANAIYLLVSVLFWYTGMLPDLATLRDRARHPWPRILFGLAALGWRNSVVHWRRWRRATLLVAAMAMPLVVSVHSGVAMLFAAGPVAGWHSTIFPPYFVLGAVFSGFAVVALIALALRHAFALHAVITRRHLDLLGKMILVTGLATDYGYLAEGFTAWYGNDPLELATLFDRLTGTYAWVTWVTLACNLGTIQLLWCRGLRTRPAVLAAVAAAVTLGMYAERFMLVVTSLYHGPVPAKWHVYAPSVWDWTTFAGTVGLFLMLMLLFLRFLPMVSMFELREGVADERR